MPAWGLEEILDPLLAVFETFGKADASVAISAIRVRAKLAMRKRVEPLAVEGVGLDESLDV